MTAGTLDIYDSILSIIKENLGRGMPDKHIFDFTLQQAQCQEVRPVILSLTG